MVPSNPNSNSFSEGREGEAVGGGGGSGGDFDDTFSVKVDSVDWEGLIVVKNLLNVDCRFWLDMNSFQSIEGRWEEGINGG